jgi:hypothetical protein
MKKLWTVKNEFENSIDVWGYVIHVEPNKRKFFKTFRVLIRSKETASLLILNQMIDDEILTYSSDIFRCLLCDNQSKRIFLYLSKSEILNIFQSVD